MVGESHHVINVTIKQGKKEVLHGIKSTDMVKMNYYHVNDHKAKQKGGLSRHIRNKHDNIDIKYLCDQCEYKAP